MKFIGKLLLYILIALLVVIAGLYFLLQTRWGAEHISAWVSENSDYHLAFGAMDHRFSAPSHIVLENVTFGRDGQPATLVAKSVDIALSSRQLTEPRHVDTILLENGTLNLTDQTAPLPFKADRLQLRDMAFNSPNSEWKLSAQRNADGSWQVENLRMADIRLQSEKSLADFFAPLRSVPSLQIGRLEVIDARLQGPDWAVTDLDLSLRNMTFSKDDWQTQEGKLSMNASEFIYGSLHLFDPIINAEFSPQGVALRQFTSRWEGGMVRTSGNWLRDGKTLILDDAAIAGLEYTLPKNWQQLWMETTPGWLNSLQLKRFSASRNLIIDIDPDFPWQLTALDGYGANLTLVTDHKWGVWSGSANLNAAAATFNRVDIRRPSLALTANSSTVNISELSAFTEKGILEATASVSQTPQRQTHISLNGRGVPVNILQQWGWPELPLTGDGNIQLTASGDIQANVPLKPTVSGQLHAVNAAKQQVTQTMNASIVSSGEVTSTEPVQ
ncbi:TPA: AsmA family protein [Escherichia coli]|nr:AsmA family protein [Escherichia coli]HBA7809231.1 AsmA family protein [Escherichia coli]